MAEIPLTRGYVAIVDDADLELVSRHRWHAQPVPPRMIYARTTIGGRKVYMHVLLMGQRGIDHQDGDGLHNRRSNLRAATQTQQNANQGVIPGRTSRFKGVTRARGKWQAQITAGRTRWLGYFTDEAEAARAYDAAARETWGDFARLNFPDTVGP